MFSKVLRASISSPNSQSAVRCLTTAAAVEKKEILESNYGNGVFRDKSFGELVRGLAILRMCTYPAFAKNAENFYSIGCKTVGKKLTNYMLRKTFFGHFVAGETRETLIKECDKMLRNGNMKVMLCPPMEDIGSDITEHSKARIKENIDRYLEFIDVAIELNKIQPGQRALVQFKPTAVFPNSIMENDSRTAEKQGTSMAETVSKYAEIMNGAEDASVHPIIIDGLQATKKMYQKAADNNIPIIVDGELRNTYFSLHAQTMAAALLYNAVEDKNTLVYGTFQCYLKDTPRYFDLSVDVSKKLNFRLGAKFVRGAYMEVEKRLAKQENREDPIRESHAHTSEAYDMLISKALKQVATDDKKRLAVLVASMNKQSAMKAVQLMKELHLPPNHPLVSFGQIYGMGDPLSWFLGNAGYTIHKSTPWGPIDEWIPYLSRRAAENYSAFQTARNELPLYRQEIRSRMRKSRD